MSSPSLDYRAAAHDRLEWIDHGLHYDVLLEELRLTGAEAVLDVGAGTGKIVECLRPYCAKVIRIDLPREMLAPAIRNLRLRAHRKAYLQQASTL